MCPEIQSTSDGVHGIGIGWVKVGRHSGKVPRSPRASWARGWHISVSKDPSAQNIPGSDFGRHHNSIAYVPSTMTEILVDSDLSICESQILQNT